MEQNICARARLEGTYLTSLIVPKCPLSMLSYWIWQGQGILWRSLVFGIYSNSTMEHWTWCNLSWRVKFWKLRGLHSTEIGFSPRRPVFNWGKRGERKVDRSLEMLVESIYKWQASTTKKFWKLMRLVPSSGRIFPGEGRVVNWQNILKKFKLLLRK